MKKKLAEILRVGVYLGLQEVKQINRRSKLGQLWITLGTATLIGTMAFVFGLIFKIELHQYLPYLAIGIVFWNYLSGQVAESSLVLIQSEQLIKQLSISPWTYAIKVSTKMLLVFGHNLVIIPIVLLATYNPPTFQVFFLLLALPVILIALNSLGMLLSIVSLRFRDLPPMISSLLNVLFYLTPVMWFADSIQSDLAHFLLGLNPVYHLIQIFRLPLLGQSPTLENWFISVGLAVFLQLLSLLVVRKYAKSLVFWA